MKDTPLLKSGFAREWGESLISLIYPERCPVCDGVLSGMEKDEHICEECSAKIRFINSPRCFKCGCALQDDSEEYCRACKIRKHVYDRGLALFEYDTVRISMYRFKYSGREEYAKFYAKAAYEELGKEIAKWRPDGIVPVPMYAAKKRMRGYDQAESFATEFGELMGIPVYTDMVKRVRATAPMKTLSARERGANLKNAFIIGRDDVKLRQVLVVDDIYTTGSTIDAVAAVFKGAGVDKVWFLTLSEGRGI